MRTVYADVDRPTDRALGKSGLYTIDSPQLTLAVAATQIQAMRAGPTNDVEYNLAFLPAGISRDQIAMLADMQRVGGTIADVKMQTGVPGQRVPQ